MPEQDVAHLDTNLGGELTNFFSARENLGRSNKATADCGHNDMILPSARPKTSERGPASGRANMMKSLEMLKSPKNVSGHGTPNMN